ncbi:MAG: hypothetical protein E5V92_17210 [Mesorhizobium sp.]|nr:MAG: hypothetical protein EOS61_05800 [Mesorhizobium sp.]TIW00944.1 MAG: hypothetical protein E5V85_01870 [Mesorhizobium sp.]TJW84017.1 MAG: hypothetical protein E5V92_17210 [Mesorhizobium sp.]
MAARRTHDQQMRITEERENTKNAPKEFDAEAEPKRSPAEPEARRNGWDLKTDTPDLVNPGDCNILRANQESEHNKNRGD